MVKLLQMLEVFRLHDAKSLHNSTVLCVASSDSGQCSSGQVYTLTGVGEA